MTKIVLEQLMKFGMKFHPFLDLSDHATNLFIMLAGFFPANILYL